MWNKSLLRAGEGVVHDDLDLAGWVHEKDE
jgi:hypothetical protein